MLPFVLRQIHVASVLGWSYWAHDIIYSFAIKVPYGSEILTVPPIEQIDAYYKAHHVLRPPATPSNSASQIFFTWRHMLEFVTVPRWGYLTILTFLLVIIAPLEWDIKSLAALRSFSAKLLVPATFGIAVGLIIFAPFSLHVYFKHEFPLIAFPFLLAKGAVLYTLFEIALRERRRTQIVAATAASIIIIDAALVHWNNSAHGEYPNLGWVGFYRDHDPTEVALSTYLLMPYADPYLGINRARAKFFDRSAAPDAEPTERYWIIQPTDYTIDFDRQNPTCRWTDWVSNLFGKKRRYQTYVNCIYHRLLPWDVKARPESLSAAIAAAPDHSVLSRDDHGIG